MYIPNCSWNSWMFFIRMLFIICVLIYAYMLQRRGRIKCFSHKDNKKTDVRISFTQHQILNLELNIKLQFYSALQALVFPSWNANWVFLFGNGWLYMQYELIFQEHNWAVCARAVDLERDLLLTSLWGERDASIWFGYDDVGMDMKSVNYLQVMCPLNWQWSGP